MATKKATAPKDSGSQKKKAAASGDATPSKSALSRQYVGTMGEHYVMAQMLARGFNVARAVVDEGIDVIAFKPDKPQFLHRIQVKTARPTSGGSATSQKFIFTLGKASYEKEGGQDFYLLLVMWDDTNKEFASAVIPKQVFDDYVDTKKVIDWNAKQQAYQIAVHLHKDGKLTMKNAGGEDVTQQIKDRWDRIK